MRSGSSAADAAGRAVRTLVVWCPDWPVVAAGVPPDVPAAVVVEHRVVVCSAAARVKGVRRGLRRREAQARCPQLLLVEHDPARDARGFEPVVAVVEELVPGVEILRPGVCAVRARGGARYFGGDEALAGRMIAALAQAGIAGRVGVAEGMFAAALAAVRAGADGGYCIVPRGGTREFLALLPVDAVDSWPGALPGEHTALVDLLRRLGIGTLGAFAALAAGDVLGRFGPAGARAHRLARGLDGRPLAARVPPPDLVVQAEWEPPVEQVSTAAFTAKALAEELDARLDRVGVVCVGLRIEVVTSGGEQRARRWRAGGFFTAAAIAERVRWQLDGWLTTRPHNDGEGPAAGVVLLRLTAEQTSPGRGQQLVLWGAAGEPDARAARALARVQTLLGPEAVLVGVPRGGRNPGDQIALVPWQEDGLVAGVGPGTESGPAVPWPREVPPPWPATVPTAPLPAEVLDAAGEPVAVSGRGELSAPPARLSVAAAPWVQVLAWAGPWPVDERWWDDTAHRRQARFQLAGESDAWLLALTAGHWWVEAIYD